MFQFMYSIQCIHTQISIPSNCILGIVYIFDVMSDYNNNNNDDRFRTHVVEVGADEA